MFKDVQSSNSSSGQSEIAKLAFPIYSALLRYFVYFVARTSKAQVENFEPLLPIDTAVRKQLLYTSFVNAAAGLIDLRHKLSWSRRNLRQNYCPVTAAAAAAVATAAAANVA